MLASEVDTSKAYSVHGYEGIAFRVLGPFIYNNPNENFDGEYEALYSVRAVMIGDDRVHEIDVDDLTPLKDKDFCDQCGQIGCGHGSNNE